MLATGSRRVLLSRLSRGNAPWKSTVMSAQLLPSVGAVNAPGLGQQQQRREFGFLDDVTIKVKTEQLKRLMEANPGNSDAVFNYLRALAQASPKDAAQFIEKGWNTGKLPVNEAYLREYFKVVGALKKFDSLNITNLLSVLQKQQGGAAAATVGGQQPDLQQLLATIAATTNPSGSGIGASSGVGSSANDPLYMAQIEPSWKTEAWKVVRSAVGLLILVSFISSMMDEKSPGGGIGGRLGLNSSAVHQLEKPDKTFADVVGVEEAKGELQEIVLYLKDPKRFTRLGGKLPKGVLLTGAPGNGKTLLARAIAGEAGVPFFFASGSEFEEMFVGVGAKRVRELFEAAKKQSPCIIFIDEIDAIGGKRQMKDQGAMKMTLNELLVQMDGFNQNNGVIVIAATNFPDSLDGALVRPGRFDKHVDVPLPDIGGRKAILELYGSKVPLESDVSMDQLARGTPGFSGAELFNLVNQAALKASVDGLNAIGMGALEYAKDKIMMGAERRSAVISPETMKCTAYHEAGHALVALHTAGANPIHKATIMPRGRALGMVMQLPEGDQLSMTREQMIAFMDVCMGGRIAEELVFGEKNVTSGASNDIQQATNMATNMVTRYGFSNKVGVMFVNQKDGKNSGETAKNVDDEIRELLQTSYDRVKALMTGHRNELEIVAKALLEYESLSGGEIRDLIAGKAVNASKRSHKPSRDAPLPTDTTGTAAAKNRGGKAPVQIPAGLTAVSTAPPSRQPSTPVQVAGDTSGADVARGASKVSVGTRADHAARLEAAVSEQKRHMKEQQERLQQPKSFFSRLWGDSAPSTGAAASAAAVAKTRGSYNTNTFSNGGSTNRPDGESRDMDATPSVVDSVSHPAVRSHKNKTDRGAAAAPAPVESSDSVSSPTALPAHPPVKVRGPPKD